MLLKYIHNDLLLAESDEFIQPNNEPDEAPLHLKLLQCKKENINAVTKIHVDDSYTNKLSVWYICTIASQSEDCLAQTSAVLLLLFLQ